MLKLKTHLFSANETINKMKRQPSEWEKIIANENNRQRINLQNLQAAHAPQYHKKRHFSKKDIQDGSETHNKCPTLLIIKYMQVKTTSSQ